MTRPSSLAALVLLVGCFSEPPSSEPNGGSTGGGSTSEVGTSGSETTDPGDESSTGFLFGTSSTGFFGTSTGFADTGVGVTGDPPPVDGIGLYEQCNLGTWQSLDPNGTLVEVSCTNAPMDAHGPGGGWRFPVYTSPAYGFQDRVLVLRPNLTDGGVVQANFNAGDLDLQAGRVLRFNYEFINTRVMVDDVGAMTFQVLLNPPDGDGIVLDEVVSDAGVSGTFEMPLDIAGPMDDITLFVLADTSVEGQGVALYGALIEP